MTLVSELYFEASASVQLLVRGKQLLIGRELLFLKQ